MTASTGYAVRTPEVAGERSAPTGRLFYRGMVFPGLGAPPVPIAVFGVPEAEWSPVASRLRLAWVRQAAKDVLELKREGFAAVCLDQGVVVPVRAGDHRPAWPLDDAFALELLVASRAVLAFEI